jgi:uncharacterized protein YjbI with pentapeptide repeats
VSRSLVAALVLVTACSAQGDQPTTAATDDPTTSSAAPEQRATTTTTATTTAIEPVELPSGVVWQGAAVDETPASFAGSIIATDDGFVATGYRGNPEVNSSLGQTAQPMVYLSPDATTWTAIELPAPGDRTFAADVAHGPAGYVAVGTVGTDCRFACPGGRSVAWVSADGTSWELIEPDSFRGAVRVSVTDIEFFAGNYVAVGKDERAGDHWAVGVWSSPDGRSWERVATLESAYSLLNDALHVVGGRLFLAADEAVCSDPFPNGDIGWVLGAWATATRLWSSTDAAGWEPVDTAAAGLADPLPEGICDDDAYLAGQADDRSAANVVAFGDTLSWRRQDGVTSLWSGSAWSSLTAPELIAELSLLPAPDGYLALGVDGLRTGVIDFTAMTSPDMDVWDDWTEHTRRIVDLLAPGLVARAPVGETAVRLTAVRGDTIVMLVTAQRDDPTSTALLGVYAIVSSPAVGVGTCAVGPGADCRFTDLAAADLAGADLAGIDLTGADLTGIDLAGADLTGATLVGADLDGADLSHGDLAGADLSRADLGFTTLVASDLGGARLAYTSLIGATIDGTTILTGADLTGAFYVPLDLAARDDVTLAGAGFDDWDHEPLDLSGASLVGAELGGDLTGFSFAGADLANADLLFATLADVDFTDADLTGANLENADLTGARLSRARLDGATWYGTTCPDGFELGYDTDVTCAGHFLDR